MSKMATKASDNVFYKARMVAAKWNDKLNSREGASEVTGLDRTRIAYIELGTITPYPEEILILADCYNAPELCNHYCSSQCPIGRHTVEPVEVKEIEAATIVGGEGAINALKAMRDSREIITYAGVTRITNLVFTGLDFDRSYKNKDGASFTASFKRIQTTSPEYVPAGESLPMTSQDAGKSDDQQLAKTANAGLTTVSMQSVSSESLGRHDAAYTQDSSTAPLTRITGGYSGLSSQ